jgi:hypothetical protein
VEETATARRERVWFVADFVFFFEDYSSAHFSVVSEFACTLCPVCLYFFYGLPNTLHVIGSFHWSA